jgi:hypothetical protein
VRYRMHPQGMHPVTAPVVRRRNNAPETRLIGLRRVILGVATEGTDATDATDATERWLLNTSALSHKCRIIGSTKTE